jgi:hypothetical protein
VNARSLDLEGATGPEVGEKLRQARIAAIRVAKAAEATSGATTS